MTKIQNHRLFFVGGLGMPNLKFLLLVLSTHRREKKLRLQIHLSVYRRKCTAKCKRRSEKENKAMTASNSIEMIFTDASLFKQRRMTQDTASNLGERQCSFITVAGNQFSGAVHLRKTAPKNVSISRGGSVKTTTLENIIFEYGRLYRTVR